MISLVVTIPKQVGLYAIESIDKPNITTVTKSKRIF